MLFKEALELLQAGEVLCRAAWSLEDGYLKLMPGMKHIWKIVLNPTPNAGNYILAVEDLLAGDWKKFELQMEQAVTEATEAA